MSLIGRVGRKRPRARIALLFLYLLLSVGAVTTLYPFFVMVSMGMKGPTDQDDGKFVPAYLVDDAALLDKYLADKYGGDLGMIASYSVGELADEETLREYEKFLMDLPPTLWVAGFRSPANNVTGRLKNDYQAWLRVRFSGNLIALNQKYGEINPAFQNVNPPNELLWRPGWKPSQPEKWADWLEFKETLPAEFRIPLRLERAWQLWMRSKFEGRFDDVPAEYRGGAKDFDTLELTSTHALKSGIGPLEIEFIETAMPSPLDQGNPEGRWAYQDGKPIMSRLHLPLRAYDSWSLTKSKEETRKEMASRNYRYVLDYVALNGKALWNTVIFCLLAVGVQLTVNPLAAYALSRFPMKSTARILTFLLATMAFPAEVAMIPSFLLLKNLGLLNTFAALVLPTAANGYMIFLLKGFFDSLPKEVFESGQIDGASERRMMMKLAMPLSKPVLGYLGLLAFMGAYSAFLYAFLVAQDRNIWTLMVFIYQLQQIAPKSVMMAAVTLAAVPTIVVFLLAQRVIMRGIVLPGER